MFGLSYWNREREKEQEESRDVLLVFSSSGTADIAPVIEVNEERILAQGAGEVEYAVPLDDVQVYIGRRGRVYKYPSSEENITDTKRIAALERSTVLRQITMFEKDGVLENKLPMGKLIMIGAVVLVILIVLAVKK